MCVSQFHSWRWHPFVLYTLPPLPASCGNTKPDSAHPSEGCSWAGVYAMRWWDGVRFFERPFDFFFLSFFLLALLPSSFSPLLPPPPKPQPPNRIPFNFVRSAPYSLFFFLSDTTGRIFLLAAAADHVGTVGSFLVCFLGAVWQAVPATHGYNIMSVNKIMINITDI